MRQRINSLFLCEYLRLGVATPTPTAGESFEGSYNHVFITGVVGPVVHCDVTSLYPSLMISYGIAPARERLEARVGNLTADPAAFPPVAAGVVLDQAYETEQGLYALTRNANVRLGAGTDFPTREQLVSGTAVNVIGKLVGKPWMLAEVGGKVVGYIHESLMIKAPGTELDLAGGPRRSAVQCRGFEQRLSVGGRSDQWEGVACKEDGRWVLKAQPEDAPVKLF